jgi:transcriptional regulator with XRE-family HTH domain
MASEETLGQRIARLRGVAGLTQTAVADAAGVPVGTYRNWEQGIREPLATALGKIARALGVSADELLGLAEPVPPPPAPAPPVEKTKVIKRPRKKS